MKGLNINVTKTKYMCITRQDQRGRMRDRVGENFTMGEFNSEKVKSYQYLGTILASDNILEEIKTRILSGDRHFLTEQCLQEQKSFPKIQSPYV